MPEKIRHTVAIVVDYDFGPRLVELARRVHAWVIDTPSNRAAAELIWRESAGFSFESGVTLFKPSGKGPLQDVADIIGTVDTHHGESSHDPPVSVLEIYGAEPRPELRAVFARYGFTHVVDLPGGFRALARPGA